MVSFPQPSSSQTDNGTLVSEFEFPALEVGILQGEKRLRSSASRGGLYRRRLMDITINDKTLRLTALKNHAEWSDMFRRIEQFFDDISSCSFSGGWIVVL